MVFENKDFGKWSFRLGMGSIVFSMVLLLAFLFMEMDMFRIYFILSLIILGLISGISGVILYFFSRKRNVWAIVFGVGGIILNLFIPLLFTLGFTRY